MITLIKKIKNLLTEEISILLLLLIFFIDIVFSLFILKKVPYTEIDWNAYMEQVEGFLSGERNYLNLRGCTGPLVYPAGFLYLFSWLYYWTDYGTSIWRGQVIFTILYLIQLACVFVLYYLTSSSKIFHINQLKIQNQSVKNMKFFDFDSMTSFKIPVYVCLSLILSKRLHSIYILRLFNDTWAIFIGYLSIFFFCQDYYYLGSIIFSLSVSIKMNLLLFSPGIFLIYILYYKNRLKILLNLFLCFILQVFIGLPFLLHYPVAYLMKAFELTRVFDYKWTVNYKFLNENLFVNKKLSILLLILTILCYFTFYWRWISQYKKGLVAANSSLKESSVFGLGQRFSPRFIFYLIASSNIIGISFARSLHYQFYSWYFHSIPFILYNGKFPYLFSSIFLIFIEYAYNVYPATALSSALLQFSHLYLLLSIWTSDCSYQEGYFIGLRLKHKQIKQD